MAAPRLATAWTLPAAGPTPIVGCDGERGGDGGAGERRDATRCRSRVRPATRRRHGRVWAGRRRARRSRWRSVSRRRARSTTTTSRRIDVGEAGRERRRRHRGRRRLDVDGDRSDADVSGPTGDPSVTAAPVSAGSYALSESGPVRATRRRRGRVWAGRRPGVRVALALGESATCTIINDDIAGVVDVGEEVVNDDGGTALATDWTLTRDRSDGDAVGSDG